METEVLKWLATKVDGLTLVALAFGIVVAVSAIRAVASRIPRFPAGFTDWWLIGAGLGAVVGLVKIELSLMGVIAGVAIGVLATGGFEYLTGAGTLLKSIGKALAGNGGGGGGTKAALLLLALGASLALSIGGCAAPLQVREAQAFEEAAWRVYMANGDRIQGAWSAAYAEARRADIEYTTAKAIDVAKRAAAAGPLSPADVEAAIRTVVEEREKAQGATARIQAALAALQRQNALEAAKALRLHGGMAEWLAAGVEESTIPGLVDEFLGMIRAGRSEGPVSGAGPSVVPAASPAP